MANELKPWKYDIQYGPEGEDAYSWVYDDHGVMVATMKTHKAKEIVDAMNTRPAATVEELETVGNGVFSEGEMIGFVGLGCEYNPDDTRPREPIVKRSQAEAIIAALTARVKELEELVERVDGFAQKYLRHMKNTDQKNEALEIQLAAAKEAHKSLFGDKTMEGILWPDVKPTDLITIRVQKKIYDKARAALEASHDHH